MRNRIGIIAIAVLGSACGGGDGAGGGGPSGPGGAATVPVASVTVEPASATLLVGATRTFTATPRDAWGHALTGRTCTWTSSDPGLFTVSSTGVVTAVAPGGRGSVTVTCEGVSGTAQVTVLAPVASISGTCRPGRPRAGSDALTHGSAPTRGAGPCQ
jgi:hypothetical protein